MTTDARHLMSVSLGKIAQARSQRGGMKLHHSLLVATVLHKARSAFMEETLRMVDSLRCQPTCTLPETPSSVAVTNPPSPASSGYTTYTSPPYDDDDDDEDEDEDEVEGDSGVVESVTIKEGIPCVDSFSRHRYSDMENQHQQMHQNQQHFEELSIWSDDDYAPPTPAPSHSVVTEKVVTIFDLDTRVNCQESALCDITNDVYHQSTPPVSNNKRKRVRDEVEDAVTSILPKRARSAGDDEGVDADLDELFRDESPSPTPTTDACVQSLTNLVSIFSFKSRCYSPAPSPTPINDEDQSTLSRSVSTPDLCGSQVFHRREEHVHVVSRAAIAMTV